MPIYEYVCPQCGATGEILQPMGASPHTCPRCLIDMTRKPGSIAMFKMGKAREKWARDWTPDSPQFSTGSLHGQKY